MDIGTNSIGNTTQVRNQVGDLTVLIGSDPFLPQPDSPTVEPEFDTVDENLNTPPLPPPSVTPEYEVQNLVKPLHPYLEAGISLDTESRRILETPTSPLDENPPLTELKPVDPEIFVQPPPKKGRGETILLQHRTHLKNAPQTSYTTDHPPPSQRLSNPHHKQKTPQ